MKKRVGLSLAMGFMWAAMVQAELPPVMATVEIRGLNALAEQIGMVASDVQAPPTREDVVQAIGGFMMSPALAGVDADECVRLFILDRQAAPAMGPPVIVSLPVTGDGQEYLDAVSTFFKPGEAEDGIEQYTADPNTPGPIPLPELFVARMKGRLIAGAERALVRDAVQAIREGQLADTRLPVAGVVALSVPCRRNADKLEPLVATLTQAASAAKGPLDAARILQAEFKILIRALRQVENVMVGWSADAGALTISGLLQPAKGSLLQRVIGELRPPSEKVASMVPAGALVAASGFFVLPDEFLDAYLEMTDEIYAGMGGTMAEVAPIVREAIESLKGQFVGDYAFGVLPGTGTLPVDIVQVATVHDAERVEAATGKILEALRKTSEADVPAGEKRPFAMKFDVDEPRTYEDVKITPYHYLVDLPEKAREEIPQPLIQWLTNLKYEHACVDNHLVYTLGSEQTMNGMIDALKRGEGTPVGQGAAARKLLPDLPSAATDVAWIRILDLVRVVIKAVPELPAEVLESLPSTSLPVAAFSVVQNGNLTSTLRVSRSDMAELATYFRNLASKATPASSRALEEENVEESDVDVQEDPVLEPVGDEE